MEDMIDTFKMSYTYSTSKIALNFLGFFLHHHLVKKGFAVLILHPGLVLTDISKDAIEPDLGEATVPVEVLTAQQSAEKLLKTLDELDAQASDYKSGFRNYDGTILPF
ncbi:hypothetical protein V1512DRAFT_17179 [Lipomyces arxii]|uniref:uncharacterized protein n=1 Tax=Lipomyces arxii TaxID=56418 RepID=UPI0034CE1103